MNCKRLLLNVIGLVAFFPASIEACSLCVSALADRVLPPIELWALVSIGLYLSASILRTYSGLKIWGIPSIGYAALVVAGAFISAGAVFGLGLVVLLLIPIIILVFNTFLKKSADFGKYNWLFKGYGFLFIVVFLSMIALTIHAQSTRTLADYIIKWSSTTPGHFELKKICNEAEKGLPVLRKVIREAPPENVSLALETIAKYGEPGIDIPILIDMLKRTDKKSGSYEKIESALSQLSGLNPPRGTPYNIWRELWQRQSESVKSMK